MYDLGKQHTTATKFVVEKFYWSQLWMCHKHSMYLLVELVHHQARVEHPLQG